MEWISLHWAVVFGFLFATSELLAEFPGVKANSVFQLLVGVLQSLKKPSA